MTSKSATHPCVFSTAFIRDEVDPRVKEFWEREHRVSAPFGDLRRMWRDRHCKVLNRYTSADCPYDQRACALAFYVAVKRTEGAHNPRGYFRNIARTFAFQRAEDKPLVRDRQTAILRTTVHEEGPSEPGTQAPRAGAGPRVHGPGSGPIRVGDLLRSIDLRPRERPSPNGEEGTE